ncbi:MAG: GH3 auxin-responsive promoter family protein [Oscillospiraceae bacterium]
MNFEEKLKNLPTEEVWQEFCGFLDMSMEEYMNVQCRLLMEQIELLSKCGLGKRIMGSHVPTSVEDFRKSVPLTTFEDYADILLPKRENMLPSKPAIWLKTTWEGGTSPAKWAPYSDSMLDTYKTNIFAAMLLSTSRVKGQFNVPKQARVLYALAPLPYATGLFPKLVGDEITMRFMPSLKEAKKLSFSKQSSVGFKQALAEGIDLFFGMSSIIYGISKNFNLQSAGGNGKVKTALHMGPKMLTKMCKGMYKSKRDGVSIKPKDLFHLSGFVCVGTDSDLFKDELEDLWGVRPLEIAGGTEPTCLGTETWSKDGLVLFPDSCFYEFIPEEEMYRSLDNPEYVPKTYLLDELVANECYELVITVLKGGAFARYRVGDIYRCIRLKNPSDKLDFPQFKYVDRIPTVIDIMGFTRITQQEIQYILDLSRIGVSDWFAIKEYNEEHHSFLHLYLELSNDEADRSAVGVQLIKEQLSACFKYYDSDYNDLKKLLGIEPLIVSLLPTGTIGRYNDGREYPLRKINPRRPQVLDLLRTVK